MLNMCFTYVDLVKHTLNMRLMKQKFNIFISQTCLTYHVFNMFFSLFGSYRPTREFFTHLETSPLPVKGCKF